MKLFGNKNNTKNESQTKKRTKKKRSTRHNSLLYLIGILLVSAVLATTGILLGNDLFALAKEDREITVTIPEDATVGQVSKLLDKSGVVNYGSFFRLFTTIIYRDVTFRPGMWTLNSNMDYRHIVNEIRLTNRSTQTVTIPEGYTIEQIIDTLVENGLSSKDELTSVLQDGEFNYDFLPDDLGNETNRLEGYLFPDTYEFYVKEEAVSALSRLLDNFYYWIFEDEEMVEMMEGEDLKEIITVASLIEKETDGTDRETIASVIYNRLNHSAETAYLLQIDASLVYAAGREITQDDYKNLDSPYNLYTHQGLPPTPIANPGLASIKAALNPEKTNYYFYALDVNGEFGTPNRHVFSKTLADHNYVQRVIG